MKAENIDDVDAWFVYYELGTTDFVVEVGEDMYQPVFLYDIDGYPTDFCGWN